MLIIWKNQIASTYENVGMEETTIDNSNQAAIFFVGNCFHLDFFYQIYYKLESSKFRANMLIAWKNQIASTYGNVKIMQKKICMHNLLTNDAKVNVQASNCKLYI